METISHELITVDDILGWNPCPRYTRKRLERLVGDGVTLMEILRSHIETKNKIWIATRPGVLSSRTRERWLEIMCERAIRRVLGKSGIPEWEIWAEQWISGTDRSAGAASNAASVANAAYEAASAAGAASNAARSAASNAARSAARSAANAAYNAANAANAADTAYATYATYGTYEVAYSAAYSVSYSVSYNAAYNAANAATAAYAAANASNALYPTYENAYAVSTAAGAARDAEQRQQVRDLLSIIKGELK